MARLAAAETGAGLTTVINKGGSSCNRKFRRDRARDLHDNRNRPGTYVIQCFTTSLSMGPYGARAALTESEGTPNWTWDTLSHVLECRGVRVIGRPRNSRPTLAVSSRLFLSLNAIHNFVGETTWMHSKTFSRETCQTLLNSPWISARVNVGLSRKAISGKSAQAFRLAGSDTHVNQRKNLAEPCTGAGRPTGKTRPRKPQAM